MSPRVALAAIPESGRRALGLLTELAGAGGALWLVGGAVRQLLAAEPLGDLDVTVRSGALALGRRLAKGQSLAQEISQDVISKDGTSDRTNGSS